MKLDKLPKDWFLNLHMSDEYVYLEHNNCMYDLFNEDISFNNAHFDYHLRNNYFTQTHINIKQIPNNPSYGWLKEEFYRSVWEDIDV